jgi:uncharacterized protein with FMN-binding domain
MNSSNKYTPRILGALAIAVVAGVGGYLLLTGSGTSNISTSSTTPMTTSSSQPASSAGSSATASTFKDGTYNTSTNYQVPHGASNGLKVTLTIQGNKITAVQTTNDISDNQSQYYVDGFNAEISSAVVGTDLSSAYAGRVGGASLTSNAFNNALITIVKDAKA